MPPDLWHPGSRRALFSAALGGVAALLAGALGRPLRTEAAAGDALIIGSLSNDSGTSNTKLNTNSSGTAFYVQQNGSGLAVRGSSPTGAGVAGHTAGAAKYGVYASNDAASYGGGMAVQAVGKKNHGLVATTTNGNAFAVRATNSATSTGSGAAIQAIGGQNTGVFASSDNGNGLAIHALNSAVDGTAALFENTSGASGSSAGPAVRAYTGGGSDDIIHQSALPLPDAAGEFAGPIGVIGATVGGAGKGVAGLASSGYGLYGVATEGFGVVGEAMDSGTGVAGSTATGIGVSGLSLGSGTGLYGNSISGYAGRFDGQVSIL